jgi:hypothetical protein
LATRRIPDERIPSFAHKASFTSEEGQRPELLSKATTPHLHSASGHRSIDIPEKSVVRLSGFEPPTFGATIRRSNQLSYNRMPTGTQ